MKIITKLTRYLRFQFKHRFKLPQISTDDLVLKLFLILIIITLSYNVVNSYQKGINNRRLIQEEEQKLAEIKAEQAKLVEEEQYYSSLEYKRIYARENQNMAEYGERLYFVDRPEEIIEIEHFDQLNDTIDTSDNVYWWKKLVFGM